MGIKFKVFPETHRIKICVEDTCGEMDIVLFLARAHMIREEYYGYILRTPGRVRVERGEEEDTLEEVEEEDTDFIDWLGF